MAEKFTIHMNTEHKIWTSIGGEKACFLINSLATGAAARAHFRRTRAGGKKDLDIHLGRKCWNSKAPVYVLYAKPVDEHIVVTRLDPPGPGFGGGGGGGWDSGMFSDDPESDGIQLTQEDLDAFNDDDGEEPDGEETHDDV